VDQLHLGFDRALSFWPRGHDPLELEQLGLERFKRFFRSSFSFFADQVLFRARLSVGAYAPLWGGAAYGPGRPRRGAWTGGTPFIVINPLRKYV
jgi:hypothetical protein